MPSVCLHVVTKNYASNHYQEVILYIQNQCMKLDEHLVVIRKPHGITCLDFGRCLSTVLLQRPLYL